MKLETRRLYLYSPQEVSADSVCAYYATNREFLQGFSPDREAAFYTASYHEQQLQSQAFDWESGRGYRFYIALKEGPGCIIGTIALSNIVRGAFQSCFLGYQLDEAHANQGYMTEAVQEMVRFGFDILLLHRVEGNVIPRNGASRRVLEKCGFTAEGISRKYLKINGVWEDHIHYVLLNEAME